jgi:hypothetical protein
VITGHEDILPFLAHLSIRGSPARATR